MANIGSTVAGGVWAVGATWEGGVVPDASDNVQINGPVTDTGTDLLCTTLVITAAGSFAGAANTSLSVYGNLTVIGSVAASSWPQGLLLSGSLIIQSGGSIAPVGNPIALVAFVTTRTITSAGTTLPDLTLSSSVTYGLVDALACGVLTLLSGTLAGATRAIVCNSLVLDGGTLTGSGVVTVAGTLTYASGVNSHTGAWTLSASGNLSWNSAGQMIADLRYAPPAGITTLTGHVYAAKAHSQGGTFVPGVYRMIVSATGGVLGSGII